MRLVLLLFLFFAGIATCWAQQMVNVPATPMPPALEKTEIQQPKNSLFENIQWYNCQRCGSENQVNWSLNQLEQGLEFIPHCNFCGKKYWPKFTPSSAIQRTYCLQGQTPGLRLAARF